MAVLLVNVLVASDVLELVHREWFQCFHVRKHLTLLLLKVVDDAMAAPGHGDDLLASLCPSSPLTQVKMGAF